MLNSPAHSLFRPLCVLAVVTATCASAAAQPLPASPSSVRAGGPVAPLLAPWQSPDDAPFAALSPPTPWTPRRRCLPSSSADRAPLELLAGFGTGAAILTATVFALTSTDPRTLDPGDVLAAALLAGGAVIFVTPLAIYGVGRAYGADGSYGAALLGEVLFGFIGATIGYELSTSASCAARGPSATVHPRLPRRTARHPAFDLAPRLALPSGPNARRTLG